MEKREWKIGEKMSGKGVWMRGGGGKKSGGAQSFSLWAHHNSISPKWGEKKEVCAGQSCPSPSLGQLFVFFYCFCLSVLFFLFFCLDKISSGLHIRSHWFWFCFLIKFCTVDHGSFCFFYYYFFLISF